MKFQICFLRCRLYSVASFAEAWIEIKISKNTGIAVFVASFAEAWIEMMQEMYVKTAYWVASFAEAWIEIISLSTALTVFTSPPSRRRGLKCCRIPLPEIRLRRLLRGGVD